ncbi:MAG: TIGR00269 family protein [Acidobacteria bacterium]|nr:TIGR00269 family protein [Acidobacteriota bacterium]
MPEHKLALCRGCYPGWFVDHTDRAIRKFNMFTRNDRILVAVSGGKDSLALWHALRTLGYEADGFYIDLGIVGEDGYSSKSKQACIALSEALGRPLRVQSVSEAVGAPIPQIKDLTARSSCSACGLVKRYFMNRTSLELGYDVIATGHNLDDEVAVLFSNTLRWETGYLARQYPVLEDREGLKRKVKPFIYFTEKQTTIYTLINSLPYVRDECPYAVGATTLEYKDVINRLEHETPGTKRRFLDGFLKARHLFVDAEDVVLAPCTICAQPTVGEVCAYCRLINQVQTRLVTISADAHGASHQGQKAFTVLRDSDLRVDSA